MNLNIYLEDSLGKELNHLAHSSGQNKNSIIREALKDWIKNNQSRKWPSEIMQFAGVKDFPAFEDSRKQLLPPKEDPLA